MRLSWQKLKQLSFLQLLAPEFDFVKYEPKQFYEIKSSQRMFVLLSPGPSTFKRYRRLSTISELCYEVFLAKIKQVSFLHLLHNSIPFIEKQPVSWSKTVGSCPLSKLSFAKTNATTDPALVS